MAWIPDIPMLFSAIKRIEEKEDLLKDSVEMFWLFCNGIMDNDTFIRRMDFWRKTLEKDKPKGGGFTDLELESLMNEGFSQPDNAVNIILKKFDSLIEKNSIEYIPDQKEAPIQLFIFLHLLAARFFRVIKIQGYSGITRESIEKALNVLNRCYLALKLYPAPPWAWEYSISLEAVASFLNSIYFFMLKIDGRYEDALNSILKGLEHIQEAYSIFENNKFPIYKSRIYFNHFHFLNDLRKTVPWIKDLKHQLFVDCFEAIKKGNRVSEKGKLMEICELFIDYSSEPWLSNNRSDYTYAMPWLWSDENEISNDVETAEYHWDHADEYWLEALGWVEAQTTTSELQEIIRGRNAEAAEERLQKYFFSEDIWEKLPSRARSSLISADNDWFSGNIIRIEAILNELKIAVEELMLYGLWIPLEQWEKYEGTNNKDLKLFAEIWLELNNKRLSPDISHFERTCRLPITKVFLIKKGTRTDKIDWFVNKLPYSLSNLRKARRDAEHDSIKDWTHQELNKYYGEFMGIGQLGIIRELGQILFS